MVMGDMSAMGGGGGAPAPCHFRFKASTSTSTSTSTSASAAGPFSARKEDPRHPKMLSPEASSLPRCYPRESSELSLARTEGLLVCLNIIDECTGEAVEEAAKGCIRQVSDFIAGWRFRDGDGDGDGVGVGDSSSSSSSSSSRMAKDGARGGIGESDLVPLAIVDAGLQQCDRSSAVEHIKRGLERGPVNHIKRGLERGPAGWVSGESTLSAHARRPQVVAVLRSHDCGSTQAALAQITWQCHMGVKGGTRSHRPLFMDALEEWYNSCSYPKPSVSSDSAHLGADMEEEEKEEEEAEDDDTVVAAAAAAATEAGAGAGVEAGESTAVRRAKAAAAAAASAAAARRRRGPVVVLLEDVEGFDKQVLRDLMNVLAQPPCKRKGVTGRQQRGAAAAAAATADTRCGRPVPIALVAIASARVGFPMDRLAPSAVRQLYTEHFHFPSSLECVEVLYDKLFIQGRLPFWMGSRLLSWIKTSFNDTHLSVGTLSKQLKMETSLHFARPASYLCLQHCRPWLRSSLVGACPEDTMDHLKYKLMRDSKMPLDRLRAALPGVPPNLGSDQAVRLIEQGLRREAARGLRLWFFHKVWKVLLKSLEERETTLGELKLADTILGRGRAAAAAAAGPGLTGLHAEFRGSQSSKRMAELGSPMRIVGLLSSSSVSKKSKRLFTELSEVSQALEHLMPVEVEGLLLDLIGALPAAPASASGSPDQMAETPAALTNHSNHRRQAGDATVNVNEGNEGTDTPRAPPKENATLVANHQENMSTLVDADAYAMAGAGAALASGSVPGGGGGSVAAVGSAGLTDPVSDSDFDTDIDNGIDDERGAGTTSPPGSPSQARVSDKDQPGGSVAPLPTPLPATATATTTTTTAATTTPCSVQGLDLKEASYLRRGAERVLKLWHRADEEGWAEPDDNVIQWNLASSHSHSHRSSGRGAAAAESSGGSRGGGGKSFGSRGNRLFNSALHQGSASTPPPRSKNTASQQLQDPLASAAAGAGAAEDASGRSDSPLNPRLSAVGGSESDEVLDGKREQAIRRACLAKELQLLFLHVMGAARGAALGPGMEQPPPLTEHTSVLAEVYCCDDRDRETLEASLCPLTRTSVDVGMMEGACKGTSSVVQKRKEMSEDQPVLDICLLYSCYRGHGKTIDRSDWFADFRSETLRHRKNHKKKNDANANTNAKTKTSFSKGGSTVGRSKSPGVGGGGSAADDSSCTDPTGSAELLARFEHASDQLASMGYVRPLKRRKKLEESRRRAGEAPGPKGAVTRLVFSYTMEDGAL